MNPLDRLRMEKAAADCGFDLTPNLLDGGELELRSAAFPETFRISMSSDTPGIFLLNTPDESLSGSIAGDTRIDGYGELYIELQRVAAAARTLPNRVADKFRVETAKLPVSTEAERMVVQRVGQGIFREALIDFWQGQCCVTGLAVSSLLRASHIKPWSKCDTDEERLDVFNGLLLAPHLDALFDGGWISVENTGAVQYSPLLTATSLEQLGLPKVLKVVGLGSSHFPYLAYHRNVVFKGAVAGEYGYKSLGGIDGLE